MTKLRTLTHQQDCYAYDLGMMGKSQAQAFRDNYSTEGWSAKHVANTASEVAHRPHVAARIKHYSHKREQAAGRQIDVDVKRLMETYIAIAFVDPNELIQVRIGCCRHCWGEGGGYQWREREYLIACAQAESAKPPAPMPDIGGGFGYRPNTPPNMDCEECDGVGITRLVPMDSTKLSPGALHLYRGAQQTKDGIKIIFADKDKALENIGRMIGAFDDKLRVDLIGKVAALQLTTTDPIEAARQYEMMIKGA